MSTFPNPLQIGFGEGKVSIGTFSSDEGYGILIRDAKSPHIVGDFDPNFPEGECTPEEGEVYLHFTNKESVLVFTEQLSKVLAHFVRKEEKEFKEKQ